jgi:hypothetical protein
MEENKCCSCEYKIRDDSEFFHFRSCLNKHGKWAHRVCKNCWWKIIIPISEEIHLKCFGCIKKLPFIKIPKIKQKISQKTQLIQIDD